MTNTTQYIIDNISKMSNKEISNNTGRPMTEIQTIRRHYERFRIEFTQEERTDASSHLDTLISKLYRVLPKLQ